MMGLSEQEEVMPGYHEVVALDAGKGTGVTSLRTKIKADNVLRRGGFVIDRLRPEALIFEFPTRE